MQEATKIENEQVNLVQAAAVGSSNITYTLVGNSLQSLLIQLDHNESIYAASGSISWMTPTTKITTSDSFDRRKLIGISSPHSVAVVCLAPPKAGRITAVAVTDVAIYIRDQKFVCAETQVKLNSVRKASNYHFWEANGNGIVHFSSLGESVVYTLKPEDELLVDEENLIAYENTVDCKLERVSGSLRKIMFAGEGLNLFNIKGPGKIWLQTVKSTELN
jgi:uncharacterized protein (AIM24 family)